MNLDAAMSTYRGELIVAAERSITDLCAFKRLVGRTAGTRPDLVGLPLRCLA